MSLIQSFGHAPSHLLHALVDANAGFKIGAFVAGAGREKLANLRDLGVTLGNKAATIVARHRSS